jgi:hypothetical protein
MLVTINDDIYLIQNFVHIVLLAAGLIYLLILIIFT